MAELGVFVRYVDQDGNIVDTHTTTDNRARYFETFELYEVNILVVAIGNPLITRFFGALQEDEFVTTGQALSQAQLSINAAEEEMWAEQVATRSLDDVPGANGKVPEHITAQADAAKTYPEFYE